MAKPKNKKSGLHKNVASVLKGVAIPQGVRNWRPPGKCTPERSDDLSGVPKPDISSVFKGAPSPGGNGARQPAGEHTSAGRVVFYNDAAAKVPRRSLRQRIWEKLFGVKN